MSYLPLIHAVIDSVFFLETADDAHVDPDTAIAQTERIASTLQGLSLKVRQEIVDYAKALADSEQAEVGITERVEFLRSFGENMGLI
jgi:hypothetical protein